MLSAFVLVDPTVFHFEDADRVRATIKTLGALVELVVADVVADAAIVTRPDPSLLGVETSAGCTIFEDADLGQALARALPEARRDNALIIAPGYAPDFTFRAEVESAFGSAGPRPLALLREPETLFQRLLPSLASVAGVLATRSALSAIAQSHGSHLSALKRALSATPMRTRAIRV